MKQKLTATALLCLAILFSGSLVYSQVFSPFVFSTTVPPTIPFVPGEAFRINTTATTGTNFFTQYFGGVLPSGTNGFGVNDRWISSGQIVPPSGQALQGYRVQRNGRTLVIGIDESAELPISLNAFVQWGGNSALAVDAPGRLPSDLLFRSFTSPTSATPEVVMRLTENSKMIVGDPAATVNYTLYPFRRAKIESYDGPAPTPYFSATVPTGVPYFSTAGIYAISQGTNKAGAATTYCAGIIADVSNNISTTGSAAVVGLGKAGNSNVAGYFLGSLQYTGSLIGPSDKIFKENINAEKSTLELIKQLNPVTYQYKKSFQKTMIFSDKAQHGFIAQELEKIFPEMVEDAFSMNENTGTPYKGVNYQMLIPVLTKAIQELQEMIESQQQRIAILESLSKTATATTKGYTLSQNVPNPFTDNTTIAFTLPNATDRGVLMVTDLNGKMLLQYNLAKGSTRQVISGNTLTSGIYVYSLIVNGSEIISKRMVLTK